MVMPPGVSGMSSVAISRTERGTAWTRRSWTVTGRRRRAGAAYRRRAVGLPIHASWPVVPAAVMGGRPPGWHVTTSVNAIHHDDGGSIGGVGIDRMADGRIAPDGEPSGVVLEGDGASTDASTDRNAECSLGLVGCTKASECTDAGE